MQTKQKFSTHPLKRAYLKRKLTGAQAAKLLDVHPMTVYFWISGRAYPTRKHIKRIKDVFGVSADDML